ncbi:hypothetical protein ACIAD1156 [Acinetobacter baylyi ADP1]|uniref:Uncharacterized protein n=1 Tax=Acinetobacter baylyi (strain ATCC 33305 / BD413 / ADP1) TaxID=62977 RepID=Q6FD24_ACIAD|nr:hypothetical protein ACIAD1156 [Acinetobacter baylyi ADP1]
MLPLKSMFNWTKIAFVLTKTFQSAKKDQSSCKELYIIFINDSRYHYSGIFNLILDFFD